MKTKQLFISLTLSLGLTLALLGLLSGGAWAATIVVTSTADSGPGTLRQALLDATSGDTITFDPAVFPSSSPATIALSSQLPDVTQGNLTIDASNAGVILDGSGIGTTPETVLLDDVSLTLDGGSNLIINGDFTAGLGHWRPWDQAPGATRNINTSDFASSPHSYEWTTVAQAGDSCTVYDTTDTSDPFDDRPYYEGSTIWITATGGSTVEVRFWYKYGGVDTILQALFPGNHREQIGDWGFDWSADWTEAVVSDTVPDDAIGVALELGYSHPELWTSGLSISSNGNTIRGLQIVNFSGSGIGLYGGAQNNIIGGSNATPGGACSGECNLSSGNGDGVRIEGSGTMSNTVSGNYIGTNISGTAIISNTGIGVSIGEGAQYNVIGGDTPGERNLISGNNNKIRPGIAIGGNGTMSNTVKGNYIGTDVSGTSALPNSSGVDILAEASGNVVSDNLISGNVGSGVTIRRGAMRNTLSGNKMGTDVNGTSALPNARGVRIAEGAQYNVIGGDTPGERNLISGNSGTGVSIHNHGGWMGNATINNTITQNSIYGHPGQGIDLSDSGNLELPAPVITNTDLGAGTVVGTACASCTIEIFSDTADEGQVYEGTTTADANGDWSFTKGSSLTGPNITATATDPQGNTSEFSAVPYRLYLPLVLKGYCSCGPDNYEPNDSFAQAYGPLTSGQTYQSYISCCDVASRRDYFYIDISTTSAIEVDLTNIPAGVDYDLYLYNSAQVRVGESQANDNLPEHISYNPPSAERYYILVFSPYSHYSASPYSLRVTYD